MKRELSMVVVLWVVSLVLTLAACQGKTCQGEVSGEDDSTSETSQDESIVMVMVVGESGIKIPWVSKETLEEVMPVNFKEFLNDPAFQQTIPPSGKVAGTGYLIELRDGTIHEVPVSITPVGQIVIDTGITVRRGHVAFSFSIPGHGGAPTYIVGATAFIEENVTLQLTNGAEAYMALLVLETLRRSQESASFLNDNFVRLRRQISEPARWTHESIFNLPLTVDQLLRRNTQAVYTSANAATINLFWADGSPDDTVPQVVAVDDPISNPISFFGTERIMKVFPFFPGTLYGVLCANSTWETTSADGEAIVNCLLPWREPEFKTGLNTDVGSWISKEPENPTPFDLSSNPAIYTTVFDPDEERWAFVTFPCSPDRVYDLGIAGYAGLDSFFKVFNFETGEAVSPIADDENALDSHLKLECSDQFFTAVMAIGAFPNFVAPPENIHQGMDIQASFAE